MPTRLLCHLQEDTMEIWEPVIKTSIFESSLCHTIQSNILTLLKKKVLLVSYMAIIKWNNILIHVKTTFIILSNNWIDITNSFNQILYVYTLFYIKPNEICGVYVVLFKQNRCTYNLWTCETQRLYIGDMCVFQSTWENLYDHKVISSVMGQNWKRYEIFG